MTLAEKIARTKGKAVAFVLAHVAYQGDECVFWPFSCNPINGYGQLSLARKPHAAHRVMCELAKGPRPTPEHHAAHSCHKRACINPRHLSWKTLSQNMLDKRENGTASAAWWGRKGKLTAAQVLQIRSLRGRKTQAEIADMFAITESNVRHICTRKTWRHVPAQDHIITETL